MADPARAMKVADRIKTVVAENLAIVIKDPDLGFVTITDVRVTGDLQSANKGRLRSVVGRELGIRLTPTIEFFPDALPETSSHLEDLLKAAKERDAQVAATAQGAHYAGEADPYRRPHDEDAQDSDADSDTAVADPA